MKKKIIIFGTGTGYERIKSSIIFEKIQILFFLDNNMCKHDLIYEEKSVFNPRLISLEKIEFDWIWIASNAYKDIFKQLKELNVAEQKIFCCFDTHNSVNNVQVFNEIINQYLVDNYMLASSYRNCKNVPFEKFLKYIEENNTLYVTHTLGGGSETYLNQIVQHENNSLIMNYSNDKYFIINPNFKIYFSINLLIYDNSQIIKMCHLLNIDYIIINQLVGYPLKKTIELFMQLKIPYKFIVHDYYSICSSYNLMDYNNLYCFGETNIQKCSSCFEIRNAKGINDNNEGFLSIFERRKYFELLLCNCTQIIAPSLYVADMIKKFYHHVQIIVIPHQNSTPLPDIFKLYDYRKGLKIGVLGEITYIKGKEIILEISNQLSTLPYKIEFFVYGSMNIQNNSYENIKNINIRGRYNHQTLIPWVQEDEIDIFLMPSITGETFSYTSEEVFEMGYPLISFDIGAPSERIKQYGIGWTIEPFNINELINLIVGIYKDKNMIAEKRCNIFNYRRRLL